MKIKETKAADGGWRQARPNPTNWYHQLSLVRTGDKVRRIHTINMNWPKHELSEYTHDVRHRVQRSTCRNLVILIIMHDYHVRTVNWGTTNTIIPQVQHQVIYNLINREYNHITVVVYEYHI